MQEKPLKTPWLYAAAIILAALCLFFVYQTSYLHTHPAGDTYDQENIPGRALMEDISLSSFSKGNKVISIRIGTVHITGKKRGFLRFGFWKVLRCNDVTVDVYPPASERVLSGEDIIQIVLNNNELSEQKPSNQDSQPPLARRLQNIAGQNLASMKGLELHNITLNIHDKHGTALLIRGGRGEIAFNSTVMTFSQNVNIQTQEPPRTMMADVVKWDLSRGVLDVPSGSAFILNGRHIRGKGIKTDLRLNVLGKNTAFSCIPTNSRWKPHEKKPSGICAAEGRSAA